ncbi:hypothetical protein ACFLX8_04040 [Chloroflexota bacterium]
MSKKVKVLISVLVLALLLAMGATTTVLAQGEEETTPPEASENGLLERVAGILGIDEEDLVNAFKQAQREMCEDTFINRLNQAVEEGRITQEHADELVEWWQQRPEAIEPGMFKHTLRSRVMPQFHMQNGPRVGFCPRLPVEAD